MASKTDKSVVRNAQYKRGGLNKRERHNERKNADYMNEDIIPERAALNVHFKPSAEGYERTFDAMVAEGIISTRGLSKDPNIVDELVFGINSAYFENHGGYDYAVSFFEEAYRCALEEIGGEQFVLSAVMHADERNRALSEQLGRDVYHYHLHVVYVPVVDKEIYFKKNNKNPELAGKLREVVKQVSHSKKWPKTMKLDDNGEVMRTAKGKTILLNAYSRLQDHFHDHMKEAGFTDFERGERGSTAEHLTVLEYKAKQEKERADAEADRAQAEAERAAALAVEVARQQQTAAALDTEIADKEKDAAALDRKVEHRVKQVNVLDKRIDDRNYAVADMNDIKNIGAKNLIGQIVVTPTELDYLKGFAREGVSSRVTIKDLSEKVKRVEGERDTWKQKYERLAERVQPFLDAIKHAPMRVMAFLKSIMQAPPEVAEQSQRAEPQRMPGHKRSHGMEL
ncbi:MAG: plasmid recombination protein [Oscillospiraceae bacterium]|nr:plasmid recombination protein [Oscillospiraceae bacterium]